MLVATLTVHLSSGFFAGNVGVEYALLPMFARIALTVAGSGEALLDQAQADRTGNPVLARFVS